MSYLIFQEPAPSASGKTKVWEVRNAGQGLGQIRWMAQWRRYWFVPNAGTGFDAGCLREIAIYCEAETCRHNPDLKRKI